MDEEDVEQPDDLYGLDPAAFTAARNRLAKRLRSEGRRELAAEVARLHRPSASAGALNRVARSNPSLVADALDTGARLRAATDAALAGDASQLREATADQRRAADALVAGALELLGTAAPQAESRVAAIVHAAAVDEAIGEELRRGVLSADHRRAGLGLGPMGSPTLTLVPDLPVTSPSERPPRRPTTRAGRGTPGGRGGPRGLVTEEPKAPAGETSGEPASEGASQRADERRREQAEERRRRQAEERARRRHLADLRAEVERTATASARLTRTAADAEAAAADARRRADLAVAAAEAAAEALRTAEQAPNEPP